jgi:hypothetical protein
VQAQGPHGVGGAAGAGGVGPAHRQVAQQVDLHLQPGAGGDERVQLTVDRVALEQGVRDEAVDPAVEPALQDVREGLVERLRVRHPRLLGEIEDGAGGVLAQPLHGGEGVGRRLRGQQRGRQVEGGGQSVAAGGAGGGFRGQRGGVGVAGAVATGQD